MTLALGGIFFLAWMLIMSTVTLFLMGWDKARSRTASSGKERLPEGLLFFLAIIGGAMGVYAGMFLFRHKTKKVYFLIGIPLLLFQQFALLFGYFPELRDVIQEIFVL